MHRMLLLTISLVAMAICLPAGCGGNRPYPVFGEVVYSDGGQASDLAGASVIFTSDESKSSSSGEIDKDGHFTLTTRRKDDGILPGSYKVVIVPALDFGVDDPKLRRPKSRLPGRYTDPTTTDLSANVESKTNHITLTLTPKNSSAR